jgi:hypothetical protein
LEKKRIRAITVLKWFYLIRQHPELLKIENSPDDVFETGAKILMNELRGGCNAD